ncbi:hypothetical protein OESDEN_01214 [Oesophagostomum dentatum]|uniref:Uncharacterized protein n=1 Tax=Oesophagostomum dentatum TaxID=61180 RepID=A0A0B1TMM9_OESDE|nr:hypothetical protein OESDEN_01214 [Oesophagostomum dentatum]
MANRMELYNIRKSRFGRRRGRPSSFNERSFRAIVGPRDTNRTEPPEAHESIRAVAFEGDMLLSPEQIEFLITAEPGTEHF